MPGRMAGRPVAASARPRRRAAGRGGTPRSAAGPRPGEPSGPCRCSPESGPGSSLLPRGSCRGWLMSAVSVGGRALGSYQRAPGGAGGAQVLENQDHVKQEEQEKLEN